MELQLHSILIDLEFCWKNDVKIFIFTKCVLLFEKNPIFQRRFKSYKIQTWPRESNSHRLSGFLYDSLVCVRVLAFAHSSISELSQASSRQHCLFLTILHALTEVTLFLPAIILSWTPFTLVAFSIFITIYYCFWISKFNFNFYFYLET